MRLATAAADPPDEPPLVRSRFHGLCVLPYRTDSVVVVKPSSGEFVLPKITSPAFLYLATNVLSKSATESFQTRLPTDVMVPVRYCPRSFNANGTPLNGPR